MLLSLNQCFLCLCFVKAIGGSKDMNSTQEVTAQKLWNGHTLGAVRKNKSSEQSWNVTKVRTTDDAAVSRQDIHLFCKQCGNERDFSALTFSWLVCSASSVASFCSGDATLTTSCFLLILFFQSSSPLFFSNATLTSNGKGTIVKEEYDLHWIEIQLSRMFTILWQFSNNSWFGSRYDMQIWENGIIQLATPYDCFNSLSRTVKAWQGWRKDKERTNKGRKGCIKSVSYSRQLKHGQDKNEGKRGSCRSLRGVDLSAFLPARGG